jgi:hypothetical protein
MSMDKILYHAITLADEDDFPLSQMLIGAQPARQSVRV